MSDLKKVAKVVKKAVDPIGLLDSGGDTNTTVVTDNSQNIEAPATITNSGMSDAGVIDLFSQIAGVQSKILEKTVASTAQTAQADKTNQYYKTALIVIGVIGTGVLGFIVYRHYKKRKRGKK
jgi:hypothetical protein